MAEKFGLVLLLGAAAAGCGLHARSAADYRRDTQALLDTRHHDIKACYQQALKSDRSLQGRVTIQFNVEPETGRITYVKVDPAGSTAPAILQDCVTNNVSGLALTPPDAWDGIATWVYEFTPVVVSPGA